MLYVILNDRLGYVDSYIYICKLISKMKLTFNFARILESTPAAVEEVVFVDDNFVIAFFVTFLLEDGGRMFFKNK